MGNGKINITDDISDKFGKRQTHEIELTQHNLFNPKKKKKKKNGATPSNF
jgi:hypothetical protein